MSLTILITVIIASFTLKTQVYGLELHQLDVDRILNALQDRNHDIQQIKESSVGRSSEDISDDKEENRYGSLKNRNLLSQIRKLQDRNDVSQVKSYKKDFNNNDKKRKKVVKDKSSYKLFKVSQDYQEYLESLEKRDSSNNDARQIQNTEEQLEKQINVLEKYLNRYRESKSGKLKHFDRHSNYKLHHQRDDYSYRHDRNSYLPQKQLNKHIDFIANGNDSNKNNNDNYLNVLVVLNPQVIQKSRNLQSLTDLILRILSRVQKDKRHKRKQRYHKGFLVNDELDLVGRRLNRDSKEIYAPKDTIEEDYKPKRSRGDYGSGRTAIPYIKHRGDIYERDN